MNFILIPAHSEHQRALPDDPGACSYCGTCRPVSVSGTVTFFAFIAGAGLGSGDACRLPEPTNWQRLRGHIRTLATYDSILERPDRRHRLKVAAETTLVPSFTSWRTDLRCRHAAGRHCRAGGEPVIPNSHLT